MKHVSVTGDNPHRHAWTNTKKKKQLKKYGEK